MMVKLNTEREFENIFKKQLDPDFLSEYMQPDNCSPRSKRQWDQHLCKKESKKDGAESFRSLIVTKRPSSWVDSSELSWVGWGAWTLTLTNHCRQAVSTDPWSWARWPSSTQGTPNSWGNISFGCEGEYEGHSTPPFPYRKLETCKVK